MPIHPLSQGLLGGYNPQQAYNDEMYRGLQNQQLYPQQAQHAINYHMPTTADPVEMPKLKEPKIDEQILLLTEEENE